MPLASAGNYLPDDDPLLKAEWEDAEKVLNMPAFTEKYSVLKYVFSEQLGLLFYILGNGADLYFGRVTDKNKDVICKEKMLALNERYQKCFILASNKAHVSLHQQMASDYFEIWFDLFELLVKPLIGIRKELPHKEVLYQCKIKIGDTRVLFNLSLLFDLDFLYSKKTSNEPLYFTNVSDKYVANYFTVIQDLPFPSIKQMVLLDGHRNLYTLIKDSNEYTAEQKKRIKVRESLFARAMAFFESSGGQYIKLESIKQFEELLSINSKKQVLQLSAHYHDGRIHTENNHIRFKKILSTISEMKNNGQLRPDVIIDASTCNNFTDFQDLKASGIQYIYYRHHNITTDIAVLIFLELYSGFVANQLKWDFPYLDGKTHLNIIYSKINRAFYISMNLFNQIKTPNIMEKVIIAEGAGLSSFLDYVEDTHEAQGNSPDFKYYPTFDKGLDEEGGADLTQLILAGMASAVGRLLINYFFRNNNSNEITIKGKTEDGQDISITLRNKSKDEIREFLNQIGYKPDNNS